MRWDPLARGSSQVFVELARQAAALRPDDPQSWQGLAQALTLAGQDEEVIAVLTEAVGRLPTSAALALRLADAHRRAGRSDLARLVLDRAPAPADGNRQLALSRLTTLMALAPSGEAGRHAREVLALDPTCGEAIECLAREARRDGTPEIMLPVCQEALRHVPGHAGARYELAAALARLGRAPEARQLIDLDQFVTVTTLAPPPTYADAASFEAALARAIADNPTLAPDPAGKATRGGFQTAINLAHDGGSGSALALLLDRIREAIEAFADALPAGSSDPFVRARPEAASLDAWAVVYPGSGRQQAHIHGDGWLSGVYYVSVPPPASDDPRSGCLVLGGEIDADDAGEPPWGRKFIRPAAGQLVLFPSHVPHATVPTGARAPRICIAFDITPVRTP